MKTNSYEEWAETIDKQKIRIAAKNELKIQVKKILESGGVVILNINHLSQLVNIKGIELCKMIATPENFYRQFEIPKRHGGMREISAPYPSLMCVQEWIYDKILLPRYQFPCCVTGFVKGRSIKDNASPHCGKDVVVQMDIKDFFPSIQLNRVINVFKILGYHNQMAYYLAKLCCKDNVLPQGAPTSPILSNIIAWRMDKRLSALSEKYNITYTRYADDLTFSGSHIGRSFVAFVSKVINDEGFEVNESKTKILRKNSRKILTGVSVSSGQTTIPKRLKRRLRQESYYVHKYGIADHMQHKGIKDTKYKLRLNGYFAYWKSIENNDVVRMLYHSLNTRPNIINIIVRKVSAFFHNFNFIH